MFVSTLTLYNPSVGQLIDNNFDRTLIVPFFMLI